MAKQNIAETVKNLVAPSITELGYTLWDLEYVKEGASKYLRITIDNDDGINIDDCEKVHRTIEPLIDEADPIEESYYLQVSSPGIERILRTDEHLKYGIGKSVDVKLYKSTDNVKAFTATLKSFDSENAVFLYNEKEITVDRHNISRINIHFDFGE